MLYEFHVLKNYPASNLNRDESGCPKTCFFGGTQRGRISSQCLKHTLRISPLFNELLSEIGIRTRHMPALITNELKRRGAPEDFIVEATKKACFVVNADKENDETTDAEKATEETQPAKKSKGKKTKSEDADTASITKQIVFYSPEDISAIADVMMEKYAEAGSLDAFQKISDKAFMTSFKDADCRPVTLDIALFGRMVTSPAFRNVEAAMQVAHAFSTHTVNMESDFYTAKDDILSDSGAAMIGDVDYNSCCYYSYYAIDTDLLASNLKDVPDADKLIKLVIPALIKIISFSNPSGKQNSFAANVLPSLFCVDVKSIKCPTNFANAFVTPVDMRANGVITSSIDKLVDHINKIDKNYDLPTTRYWMSTEECSAPQKAIMCESLTDICNKITES